ncbi:MAG: sulfatase-like hydrolase/transferase, partial [Blastopirellula sp. JB062]
KHPLPDSAASTDPQAAASLHLPKKSNRYWDPEVIQDAKRLPAGPDDFGPDLYCDFVCDFIRQNREKPFLIYYSMTLIHKHNRQFPDAPDFEHPGRRLPPTPESSVRYIDHLVGRITETVDRLGLQENTFVLFTSDNGPADHGKNQTVEQGVRVPLIVRGPGIAPGAVSSELVSLVDVYPTLVELSGGALPKDRAIDGVSMAPVWFDRPGKRRDWLFSYQGPNRMLRDKRWLLQGTGEFLDCGENRDGKNYRNVTNSKSPEVVAARERFAQILQQLPAPQLDPSATQRTRKSK